jgi:hypothetical protein
MNIFENALIIYFPTLNRMDLVQASVSIVNGHKNAICFIPLILGEVTSFIFQMASKKYRVQFIEKWYNL